MMRACAYFGRLGVSAKSGTETRLKRKRKRDLLVIFQAINVKSGENWLNLMVLTVASGTVFYFVELFVFVH
jgi:hypothetical protein